MSGILSAVVDALRLLAGLTAADLKALVLGALASFLRVLSTPLDWYGVDRAGWGLDWISPEARSNCTTDRPDRGVGSGDRTVFRGAAGAYSSWRGLGVGSIVLLLLGTQWYVLFNVIAGAMAIPTDLKDWSRPREAGGTPASWQSISISQARRFRPSV